MKTIIALTLFVTTHAFAIDNITCKGAVDLSLRDAETTTRAINTMPITASIAIVWTQRDLNNLGNVTAGCRDNFDAKAKFCSRLPALVKARASGISWNVRGGMGEMGVLQAKTNVVLSRVKQMCQ